MASSVQTYIDELYNQGQTQANRLKEQRTQADEEFIRQANEAIDRNTAASTKPYQSQIEQLPGQYQKLYDANAVQELVNRRQVQETMSNMGLTDSGLNRTQQTAIALQRGNADADTRLAQQQKTQELQDKIAELIEAGAAQKQQQEASVRNNTSNWYNDLLSSVYSNAVQQGTSRYNAEQEAAAAKAAAEAEAAAKAQQQQFDNAISVITAMKNAGASEEAMLDYMSKTGLIGSGASGSTTSNTAASSAVNSVGNAALAGAQAALNANNKGTISGSITPGTVLSKTAFQRAQRLGRTDLQNFANYDEYLIDNFIRTYTPEELKYPSGASGPRKYDYSGSDLDEKLAEQYNAGNLSLDAFKFLCKYYNI